MKLKNILNMMLFTLTIFLTTISKICCTATTVIITTTWDDTLDFDAIEKILSRQNIKSLQPFKDFAAQQNKKFEADNTIFLVTFDNGVKAVFKPGEENISEVIAYKASQLFHKYRLVPPTVYRQIGDEHGSLQLYVETDIDLLKENTHIFSGNYWDKINQEQINYMKMFYFIFGQWDINAGNQLIVKNNDTYTLALIDNSGIANLQQVQYGDYAFIRCGYSDNRNDSWDEPFPFDNPQELNNISLNEIKELFSDYMTTARIEKFWNRFKNKQMNYCLWRNSLWIQYYKEGENKSPLYIEKYSEALIKDIEKIDHKILEDIWLDAKGILPKTLIKQLIETTLNRCKQILNHASTIH